MNNIIIRSFATAGIWKVLWKHIIKGTLIAFGGAFALMALVGIWIGPLFGLAYLGDIYHPAFFFIGGPLWIGVLGNFEKIATAIDNKWLKKSK